jgi:hypothetical protein
VISAAFDPPVLSIRELRTAERLAWDAVLQAARDLAAATDPDQAPDARREQLAGARLNLAQLRHVALDAELQERCG